MTTLKNQLESRLQIIQPKIWDLYSDEDEVEFRKNLCSIDKKFNDAHDTAIKYIMMSENAMEGMEEQLWDELIEISDENEIPDFNLHFFNELAKGFKPNEYNKLVRREQYAEKKKQKEAEKEQVVEVSQQAGEWGYFDITDKYYRYNFSKDITQVFNDLESAIVWLKRTLPRIMGIILKSKNYYYIKANDDERMDLSINNIKIFEHSMIKYKTPNGQSSFKLIDFIHKHENELSYLKLLFEPRNPWESVDLDRAYLRTFIPFQAQPVEDIDMERVNYINDFIFKVISSEDEKTYNYVLDWLACIIKYPRKKTGQCLVLYSKENGVGKNSFIEFLTKMIFGLHNSVANCNFNNIAGKFNGLQENKLLVCVNEASTMQDSYTAMFDKFKTLLTEDTQTFEKKGQDSYIAKDYTNYIFPTNNENVMKVSETNRRVALLKISNIHLQDRKYFSWLNDEMLDQYGANHYMTYLYHRQVNPIELVVPKTQLAEDVKRLQRAKPLLFLEDIKDQYNDYAVKLNTILTTYNRQNPYGHITKDILYKLFESWFRDNGFQCRKETKITFGKRINEELGKAIIYKNKHCYPAEVFNLPKDCETDFDAVNAEPWFSSSLC